MLLKNDTIDIQELLRGSETRVVLRQSPTIRSGKSAGKASLSCVSVGKAPGRWNFSFVLRQSRAFGALKAMDEQFCVEGRSVSHRRLDKPLSCQVPETKK